MIDVDFEVVGDWLWRVFQKVGQAVIHELHKKRWQVCVSVSEHAQVLGNV